jgi:hypothetical protein
MHVVLFSFEASMGEIIDNPIKPSVLQVCVKPHFCHINTMQNNGAQSFQLHYVQLCFAVLSPQSLCKQGFPTGNAERVDKYISAMYKK